jgi:hypothetical protein
MACSKFNAIGRPVFLVYNVAQFGPYRFVHNIVSAIHLHHNLLIGWCHAGYNTSVVSTTEKRFPDHSNLLAFPKMHHRTAFLIISYPSAATAFICCRTYSISLGLSAIAFIQKYMITTQIAPIFTFSIYTLLIGIRKLVAEAGIEPASPFGREILNLLCLPFHHSALLFSPSPLKYNRPECQCQVFHVRKMSGDVNQLKLVLQKEAILAV